MTFAKEEDLGVGEVARKFKGFLSLAAENKRFLCLLISLRRFFHSSEAEFEISLREGNVKAMVRWLNVVAKDYHRPL